MEETMSHLFPHKPKDHHAYWTIEGLSEFIARASLGSYENFNHYTILKRKQDKQTNKQKSNKNNNKKVALDIFFIKFQGVSWLKLKENRTLAFF